MKWQPCLISIRPGPNLGLLNLQTGGSNSQCDTEPVHVVDFQENQVLRLFLAIRRGYDAGTFEPLEEEERAMVPPLMIEAMIVEGIVPVAMHGNFGDVQGDRFLSPCERYGRLDCIQQG